VLVILIMTLKADFPALVFSVDSCLGRPISDSPVLMEFNPVAISTRDLQVGILYIKRCDTGISKCILTIHVIR